MAGLVENWERIQESNSKKRVILDYSKIEDIEIEGINHNDCPDYCDAFISDAYYNGRQMTDEELEELNDDGDFVYDAIMDWIH